MPKKQLFFYPDNDELMRILLTYGEVSFYDTPTGERKCRVSGIPATVGNYNHAFGGHMDKASTAKMAYRKLYQCMYMTIGQIEKGR